VVWDLNDAVLLSVTEVEKQQHKSVAALAASLCKDKWIFYASEGSNSIKVAAADGARDPPKKISRKAASRSSQLTALAYESSRRVLAAGASDGSLQLWHFSEENSLASTAAKEEVAIVTPLFAAQMTQSPVVRLVFAATGQYASLLLVAYQNRVVEVWDLLSGMKREPSRVAVLHWYTIRCWY
jgi:WD40 repeat protein